MSAQTRGALNQNKQAAKDFCYQSATGPHVVHLALASVHLVAVALGSHAQACTYAQLTSPTHELQESSMSGTDGLLTVEMDSDKSLSTTDIQNAIIRTTGDLASGARTLSFPAPADPASSYYRELHNTCTNRPLIVSVGVGNTIHLYPKQRAFLQFDSTGVSVVGEKSWDPRDFGCACNGVDDDTPAFQAFLNSFPVGDRMFPIEIRLPPGRMYFASDLHVTRPVWIRGRGTARDRALYGNNDYTSAEFLYSSIWRFAPLRGVIVHGQTAQRFDGGAGSSATNSLFEDFDLVSYRLAPHTSGDSYMLLNPAHHTRQASRAYPKGHVVIRPGAVMPNPSEQVYLDGLMRSGERVCFRALNKGTTAAEGTPTTTVTTAMDAAEADFPTSLGSSIVDNDLTWLVESIPKDYVTEQNYALKERVVVPGVNDAMFECVRAGTSWDSGPSLSPENGIGVRCPDGMANPALGELFHEQQYTISNVEDGLPGAPVMVTTTAEHGFLTGETVEIEFLRGSFADLNGTHTVTVAAAKTFTLDGTLPNNRGIYAQSHSLAGGHGITARAGQVKWRTITCEALNIISSSTRIRRMTIAGFDGGATISSECGYGESEGNVIHVDANFCNIEDVLFAHLSCGYKYRGSDSNAGNCRDCNFQFMGQGRTNVDAAAYLDLNGRKWGNGGFSVLDRSQGDSHSGHYSQFSDSPAYRNDAFFGAAFGARFTHCIAEARYQNIFRGYAVVYNCTTTDLDTSLIESEGFVLDPVYGRGLRELDNTTWKSHSEKRLQFGLSTQNGYGGAHWMLSQRDDFANDPIGWCYDSVVSDDALHGGRYWWTYGYFGTYGRFAFGMSGTRASEGRGFFRFYRGYFNGDETDGAWFQGVGSRDKSSLFVRGGARLAGDRFDSKGSTPGTWLEDVVISSGYVGGLWSSYAGQSAKIYQRSIVSVSGLGDPIDITVPSHQLVTGMSVRIADVSGNTNANGDHTITVIDDDTFRLDNTLGNDAYGQGGKLTTPSYPNWLHEVARPADHILGSNGYVYRAIAYTGQTHPSSEPNWALAPTIGNEFTSGNITYRNVGPAPTYAKSKFLDHPLKALTPQTAARWGDTPGTDEGTASPNTGVDSVRQEATTSSTSLTAVGSVTLENGKAYIIDWLCVGRPISGGGEFRTISIRTHANAYSGMLTHASDSPHYGGSVNTSTGSISASGLTLEANVTPSTATPFRWASYWKMMEVRTELFDPASLNNQGMWAPSFVGSPWVGVGGNLQNTLNPATVGTSVNGHTPAAFNGSDQSLAAGNGVANYLTKTEWAFAALVYTATAPTDPGDQLRHTARVIASDSAGSGYWGIAMTSTGPAAYVYNNVYKDVIASETPIGNWIAVFAKAVGGTLYIAANTGAYSSVSAPQFDVDTGPLTLGVGYGGAFFSGSILEVMTRKTAWSDSERASIYAYWKEQYPGAGLP